MLNCPDLLGILLNSLSDSVVLISPDGTILCANEATGQLIEGSAEEAVGKHCWEVFHTPPLQPDSCPLLKLPIEHHKEKTVFFRKKWLQVTVDPMLDSDGKLLGIVHIMRDVTKRVQLQEALQIKTEKLKLIVGSLPSALVIGFPDWTLEPQNPAIEEITGYGIREFGREGIPWNKLIVSEDIPGAQKVFKQALKSASGTYIREYRIHKKNGKLAAVRERGTITLDENGRIKHVVAVFHPLSSRELKGLFRDQLTGLYNRRFMEEILPREFSRTIRMKQSVAMLMIDLDCFKRINDTFGHQAGDKVLREVAQIISKYVRLEDSVCRYGGEEILAFLPNISPDDIFKKAEDIRKAVSEKILNHSGIVIPKITISIGVSVRHPEKEQDFNKMIGEADKAMYAAKKAGRNQVMMAGGKQPK